MRFCISWSIFSISAMILTLFAEHSGPGELIEIFPVANNERAIRVELFGDEIERITEIDVLTGEIVGERDMSRSSRPLTSLPVRIR